MKKLSTSFYQEKDVVKIGKKLLGKFLFTKMEGFTCGGMIVETESYKAAIDKASHAYNNRYTERTKPMYEPGGITYVYQCYGIHFLLNIVTNIKTIPDAVLIRAIEPVIGLKKMKERNNNKLNTSGPSLLSRSLKITKKENMINLNSNLIWIEDRYIKIPEKNIIQSPRVGVKYAEEDAFLPWRFRIKENRWTSKAK